MARPSDGIARAVSVVRGDWGAGVRMGLTMEGRVSFRKHTLPRTRTAKYCRKSTAYRRRRRFAFFHAADARSPRGAIRTVISVSTTVPVSRTR